MMAANDKAEPAAGGEIAFEPALAELEQLVARLESGDLPLEEALRTFEQGVRLTRTCQSALASAQQQVQILIQRGDGVVLEDFEAAPGGEARAGA